MIRQLLSALCLAAFCLLGPFVQGARGQDSATNNASMPASTASTSTTNAQATTEKPKKVWTNDDVKTAGGVSVFGDSRNQKYTMTKPADRATIAKYKNDLQKLQAELNDVNKKLQDYRDFASGKPANEGGRDLDRGYNRTPVDQQIAKLQDKKKRLEDHIDALYDSARKQGIESGQLK